MVNRTLTRMLAIVACVILACAFAGCASQEPVSKSSEQISTEASDVIASSEASEPAPKPEPAATGVRHVLVIGDDKWEDYDPHADMMCLLRIDLDNKVVHEVTIPRDTKYNFGDYYQKLNQMLTKEGAAAQTQAASEVVGVPIDYYVKIGFGGLETVADHFGGIEVNLPYSAVYTFYTKDYPDESFSAGEQLLTGWRAAALSRTRTGYGKNGIDNQEMIRQYVDRQMLTTLMSYAYRNGTDQVGPLLEGFQGCIETNIPLEEQVAWAKALGSSGSFEVIGTTGPFVGDIDNSADGAWLVYEDKNGWANLMNAVENGGDIQAATQTFMYPYFTDATPAVTQTTVTVG